MGKLAWDRGVDYNVMYKRILEHYKNAKRDTQRAYDIILLTQLRNGSRITEAIMFLQQIASPTTFKREAYIPVEKRKDGYKRLMVLPPEINKRDVLRVAYIIKQANKQKLHNYAKRTYNINTHSLRYAFITYLAKKGINPTLIAKMTGHKRLDYILHYTQKTKAEEILKNIK